MKNNTEEILDLKYKKSKLESNYKNLVEFLECAQSDSALPGIFIKHQIKVYLLKNSLLMI